MPDQEEVDYAALAPGIRRTVRWLRSLGYETTDSGDGKANQAAGMTCAEPWGGVPMVAMVLHGAPLMVFHEANYLYHTLGQFDLVGPAAPGEVQLTYSPGDGTTVLLLTGVDDDLLPPHLGLSPEGAA